jgi:uncharacterized protein YbjQ (UPF0145 family)
MSTPKSSRATFKLPPEEPLPSKPEPDSRPDLLGGQRGDVPSGRVLVTAGDGFDGYEIMKYQGVCWGISVRAKDVGQDCLMGCKNITGGELQSYAELGDEARQRALDRMFQSAKRQGANAVINFRFEIAAMQQAGGASTVAFGTAVYIRPIPDYIPTGAAGALLRDIADQLGKAVDRG